MPAQRPHDQAKGGTDDLADTLREADTDGSSHQVGDEHGQGDHDDDSQGLLPVRAHRERAARARGILPKQGQPQPEPSGGAVPDADTLVDQQRTTLSEELEGTDDQADRTDGSEGAHG